MPQSTETALHRQAVVYIMLDSSLCITEMSEEAPLWADDPRSVQVGNDIRLGFPELVGAEADLQAVLEGNRPSLIISGISRIPHDAAPFFVTVTVTLYRGASRSMDTLVLMVEDVSKWMDEIQRRTQMSNDAIALANAMTASKVFIENIFDAIADMLIVTSANGIINAVNRATLTLTEYTSTELIDQPITLILPGEQLREGFTISWQSAPTEFRCVSKSGESIPVSFTRAPLDTEGHVLRGVVYLGRDLREQKQAAARISKLETENLSLHEVLRTNQDTTDIVWSSPVMNTLMENLSKVAATDTTVLITGETGTGKELVARAIHNLSSRSKTMLVTVNCAALPEGLVESELFGHEKGSFTGALQKRTGRFELADGGTIFLDEIGELPMATQAKLLRVLQGEEFERVGGTHPVRINTRVIAATNRDLAAQVREGRFREDLLFRLNVFPLHVPPLRERPEEIPLLVEHFLRLFSRRTNKHVTSVDPKAMRKLMQYSWPGNVRELANVIERAMIVCDGQTLTESKLALVDVSRQTEAAGTSFDEMARQHLLRTLEECGGVIEGPRGAAAILGLKPATLRSRLRKLGIERVGGGFRYTS
ncbi:MAG: domain S-box protein [Bacteroidetes bacterium]|nr:domain S-box protein [Bacteroidota bacterium]